MVEQPKQGRILPDLRQRAEVERDAKRKHREWVEAMLAEGCPDPENPEVYLKWKAERDITEASEWADTDRMIQWLADEEEELQRIKDCRPLGVPPPIEPRSIHAPVPQPPWKRKLRP